tara:strand:+ start:2103 stop:2981 length:879 start_codon:yes stop_codon:yes gene_type:complete
VRDDFVVFILTHGRADNQITVRSLEASGYTGRWYIVIDDDDEDGGRYRELYGDRVLTFSKDAVAAEFDQGDNFTDRRSIFYARNACWALAEQVGARYFIELDDDYRIFLYRMLGKREPDASAPTYHGWKILSLDQVFEAMVRFVSATPAVTLAMSQGGDHIGGEYLGTRLSRKAMNSFVCDVERPFPFLGRINEDVSSYVSLGNVGRLFFTFFGFQLNQTETQKAAGGLTDIYLDVGTYVKSFYSVMYAPSCVRVEHFSSMRRLHHRVNWDAAVPKIIAESWRAPLQPSASD